MSFQINVNLDKPLVLLYVGGDLKYDHYLVPKEVFYEMWKPLFQKEPPIYHFLNSEYEIHSEWLKSVQTFLNSNLVYKCPETVQNCKGNLIVEGVIVEVVMCDMNYWDWYYTRGDFRPPIFSTTEP